ncbi:hypothetical protein BKM31_14105 [[Actinomadura] parvosata subsp. kistnae]|uniref:Uncharacterized protein n=1 Tax=[Actinomadura] parvosata subsp. kistnae TaxID=1909395 RepID=A0A1V0AJH4_9ACTN|nr:hypothetical protein BKM31_14105 [Nonomuraea sp. ATCC 55076]
MIIMDAVLEIEADAGSATWPIAAQANGFLALSGRLSPAEVGSAMAVIFGYGGIPTAPISELHHLLDRHLADAGRLIAPGGLRVRDTATGAEILPGCCCGLENWRQWRDVLRRQSLWLGHDPDTYLTFTGEAVRLTQEPDAGSTPARVSDVEIRLDELPALLTTVQLQLQGFLRLVHTWAGEIAPRAADRLVTVLDENFRINGTLDLG